MFIKSVFFPENPPTEQQRSRSRVMLLSESAVAAVISAVATGNFMAGYLSELGASISLCAAVAMIPQLGCVLQLVSPLLFERLKHRKLMIWLLCVAFRVSLGFVMTLPILLNNTSAQLWTAIGLYTVAFLAAGAVTPGLQNLILSTAPEQHRGNFFALKEISSALITAACTLFMGKQLDYHISVGQPRKGYLVIGFVCMALAVLDAVLLASIHETETPTIPHVHLKQLMQPLHDKKYRPYLMYSVLSCMAGAFASPFLSVYELRVLGLSHTFITSAGVAASLAGMLGSWFWGHFADHSSWKRIVLRAAFFSLCCTLAWAFTSASTAAVLAPIILIVSAACVSGTSIATINLQYNCSPAFGKTTYIGVTSALSSIAACIAAALSSNIQSALQSRMGDSCIRLLFAVAAAMGFLNLFIWGKALPDE